MKQSIHQIDGYYFPRPHEPYRAAFDRAKLECVEKMATALREVCLTTWQEFADHKLPEHLLDETDDSVKREGAIKALRELADRLEGGETVER